MDYLPKILRLWIAVCKPLSLAALALAIPVCALSQAMSTNNSYATMLQNNAIRQSNLTQQMINLGGRSTSGSGAPVCLPPIDLQRGPAGIVPPALQGDPRYQEYLRCRYGNGPITAEMANAPALPVSPASGGSPPAQQASWNTQGGATAPAFPAPQSGAAAPAQHLPIAATDFVPVQLGHPVVDQSLANMPLSPLDRMKIYNIVNSTFNHVAITYRPNNLAVSMAVAYSAASATLNGTRVDARQTRELALGVNDTLAQGQFARMSDVDKQNSSDLWVFEAAVIAMLRDLGQHGDAQSAQQAVELSRTVLQRLNGS